MFKYIWKQVFLGRIWWLWAFAFCYSATIALSVQLIFLPVIFPEFHAGHGLLTGLDSVSFHDIAINLLEAINKDGLVAWELRPKGQGPAGIAAFIYYFTIPEPWILIPLNAGLHALSFVLVAKLLMRISNRPQNAFFAALPFLLFPSSLTWVAQIHKDTFSIPGLFLIIYSVLMSISWAQKPTMKKVVLILLGSSMGMLLVWSVRPYLLQVVQVLLLAFLAGGIIISLRAKHRVRGVRLCGLFVVLAVIYIGIPRSINYSPEISGLTVTPIKLDWQSSTWVPSRVDQQFESIGRTRQEFQTRYTGANGNVDENVHFTNAFNVVAHLPRSMQLLLFSPFPYQWLQDGSSNATTLMKREAGVEMSFNYLSLAFLPFTLWYWRREVSLWITLTFCVALLLPYGVTITNIGTLYRMRYGPYMLLVGLGVVGFLEVWRRWQKN